MKPHEFWNSTYREINLYTQACMCNIMDRYRQEINIQEAVSDKIIMADAMSNKRPKIIPLHKVFEKLFPKKEERIATADEITKAMRQIMKSDKR